MTDFHQHMMRGAMKDEPIILYFSPEVNNALRQAAAEEYKSVEDALQDWITARVLTKTRGM